MIGFFRMQFGDLVEMDEDFPLMEVDRDKFLTDSTYETNVLCMITAHARHLITHFPGGVKDDAP